MTGVSNIFAGWSYLAAFGAALGGVLAATPIARRVALRFGVLDLPADRKIHSDPVPYLGGAAIVLAFVAGIVSGRNAGFAKGAETTFLLVVGSSLVIFLLGLWDDLRTVKPAIRVAIQVVLAVGLYVGGIRVELVGFWLPDFILTVLWIVGITNAFNLLDNMDGLSAGISTVAAAIFFFLAAMSGQFLVASLSAAVAGVSLGFLFYNRQPAKIFMGDGGSLFLGFILAVLGIKLRFPNIRQVTFLVPLTVLGVPIVDTALVVLSRYKRGAGLFTGAKDHISHRLLKVGLTQKQAVWLLYFCGLAAGWSGVVIAFAKPLTALMVVGGEAVLAAFLVWLLMRVDIREIASPLAHASWPDPAKATSHL